MTKPRSRELAIMGVDDALAASCQLPPAGRAARGTVLRDVLGKAANVSESDNGVVVRFPAHTDIARSALELVLEERQCCPRFHYAMTFPPGADTFEVGITASADLVAPLKALYRGLAAEAARE